MTLKEFREQTWDMPEQTLIYIERPKDYVVKDTKMLLINDPIIPEITSQYLHCNFITKNKDKNKIFLSYFD